MARTAVNGRMVTLARESRGLSQKALADILNISQGKLSKVELGLQTANDELLEGFSKSLDYPSAFFLEPEYIYPPAYPFHRKKSSLSKNKEKLIEAKANIHRIQLSKLLASVEINDAYLKVDLDDYEGRPENVAIALRAYWKLPRGPLENVTEQVEKAGIIVVPMDFQTDQLDGFTIIAPGLTPIVFLNQALPGDRFRFTLCHELGHIIMHSIPTPNAEEEANRFASELLMPAKEIRPNLTMLTIPKLAALKPYWKVSMQALLKRAGDLYTISKSQAKRLWIAMGPYRKQEPVQIPSEKPRLFKEIIRIHREDLKYSDEEMERLLCLSRQGFLDFMKSFCEDLQPVKKLRLISSN